MLVLISGLPGSGKSTIARAYVAQFGGVHLSSDAVRADLGLKGHYQPGDKQRVYDAMLQAARQALDAGETVVADSTFYRQDTRTLFEHLAAEADTPAIWVLIRASEHTIRQRLRQTRPDSEAGFAVYETIRDQFEPFTDPHLTLWSDQTDLKTMINAIRQYSQTHHDA